MSDVAAILLAAGLGSRYRALDPSVPTKLVAEWQGLPLVRHVALAALASRARPVVVVTGHAVSEVEQALAGLDLNFVHNDDFACGLSSSLRRGLAALPADAPGALILLGDMPGLQAPLLDRLIEAFGQDPNVDAVVPCFAGQRGNPALLSKNLFAAATSLQGDEGARRLLNKARICEVDVAEPAVVIDIDEPAMLRQLPS